MNSRFKKIIYLFLLCNVTNLFAQDIHFTQYLSNPTYYNPAFTGFFDGQYRIQGIYRNQYNALSSPYQTMGASVDASLLKGKLRDDYLGVGVTVFSDKAGTNLLYTNVGSVNLAYSKGFGTRTKSYLSLGFSGSLRQRTINNNLSKFPDAQENIASMPLAPDLGVGMNYQIVFSKKINWMIGGSMLHILNPKESFVGVSTEELSTKIIAHTSAKLKAGKKMYVIPNALFSTQGPQNEIMAGSNFLYTFGDYERDGTGFTGGFLGRFGNKTPEAFALLTKIEHKGWSLGASYDFNVNELSIISKGRGAFEISAGYVGGFSFNRQSQTKCPRFKSF